MPAKNLFRRVMTKALRSGPTLPIRAGKARPRKAGLWLETLEERETPAVTASMVGSTLTVNLGATGDIASLILNGANIEVRDQTNTLIFNPPAGTVTAFNIQGIGGAATQTVNLNSAFTLTGAIAIGDNLALGSVSDVNFSVSETAASVSVKATNTVIVNAITATAAAGSVYLLADSDNDGVGSFTQNSGSISTNNGNLNISGRTVTETAGTNLTTGTGNVVVTGSTAGLTYSAPATGTPITNTSGTFTITDPTFAGSFTLPADTTPASFTGTYIVSFAAATGLTLQGLNTSAGNAGITVSVGGAPGTFNLGGAVNAGTGVVNLTTTTGAITDAGGVTVTGSRLNASAVTGIGASGTPLVTAVGQLQATDSTSGGITIANTGAVSIVGSGVNVNTAGNITLSSTGTLSATTGGALIFASNGTIAVTTTGGTSDILLGGSQTAIRTNTAGNNVTLTAGQDVVFGAGVTGWGDTRVAGNLQVLPARDAIIDNDSLVRVTNAAGTATVTAGRNVGIQKTHAPGAYLHTAGGAIAITTAANGTFTLDPGSGSGSGLASSGGPITVNANTMLIKDAINAAAGAVALALTGGSAPNGGTATINGTITGSPVTITGTGLNDTFNLVSDPGGSPLTINGGAPTTVPGDVLNYQAATSGTITPTAPGAGTVTGGFGPTVTYSSIETLAEATPSVLNIDTSQINLGSGIIGGDGVADTVNLKATNGGADLLVTINGTQLISTPFAGLTTLNVSGSSDTDTLVVDYSGGNIPASVIYDAKTGASNTLTLQGGTFASEVSSPSGPHAGTVQFNGFNNVSGTNAGLITYSNLTPMNDTATVTNVTYNGTAGPDTINVVDGPVAGQTQVNSGAGNTFELVNFANKTNVTVAALGGNDSITLNNPNPATGLASLTLDTGAGSDTVTIDATSVGTTVTKTAPAGAAITDTVTVGNAGSLAGIVSPLTIQNPSTFTAVTVDGSAAATAQTGTLSGTTLTGLSAGTITFGAGLGALTIGLGTHGNTFTVAGTPGSAITGGDVVTLNSGAGSDTVLVQATSATSSLSVHGQSGIDTVAISNAGSVQGILGNVSVDNAGQLTKLTIDDSADGTGRTVTATSTQVTGLAPAAISYNPTDITTLTVDGGTATNTFNVNSTIFSSTNTFNGGSGADTFNIAVGAIGHDSTNNFNGQGGNDLFNVNEAAPAANVTLNVDGGGQAGDVLNVYDVPNAANTTYGISTTQVTVGGEQTVNYTGLTTGSVVVNAGSGGNTIGATGSAAASLTVNGGNGVTTWNITGTGLQTGSTNIFNGGNQPGTTGDTFNVTPATAALTAITVNGNNPSNVSPGDTLNINAGGVGVTITPTGFTVAGAQTVSDTGIETVNLTNAGAVTVTGANTPNTLSVTSITVNSAQVTLNGGPAIVVGSVTSFTFNGGTGNDTMALSNPGLLFAPGGGIFYNGGGHTSSPGDVLQVTGNLGFAASGSYTVLPSGANGNAGTLTYTVGATTQTLHFTGLQPVEDLTALGVFTVNGPAVGGATNIVAGPNAAGVDPVTATTGQPTYEINFTPSDGSTAEKYDFRNKQTVIFNGSNSTTAGQADTITENLPTRVDAASPFALTTLNINPQGSPAAGDVVNVQATPAGVATAINGSAAGFVNVGSLAPTTTGGVLTGINGAVQIQNPPSFFRVTIDASGDTTARPGATLDTVAGNFDRLTGLGNAAAITYHQPDTASLVVNTANAATTLLVNQTGTGSFLTTVNYRTTGNAANVQATSAAGAYVLNFSGTDTATIGSTAPALGGTLTGINGAVEVNNPSGGTTVNVDDSGGAAQVGAAIVDAAGTVPGSKYGGVTGLGNAAIIRYAVSSPQAILSSTSAAGVNVYLPTVGGNSVTVNQTNAAGAAGFITAVQEGTGNNNTVNVRTTGTGIQYYTEGTGTGEVVNIGSNAPAVTGNLAGIGAAVVVDNHGGSSTLNVDDTGAAAGGTANIGTITAGGLDSLGNYGRLSGLDLAAGRFIYWRIGSAAGGPNNTAVTGGVNVSGNNLGNTFNVNDPAAPAPAASYPTTLRPGAGTNTVNIQQLSTNNPVLINGQVVGALNAVNTINLGLANTARGIFSPITVQGVAGAAETINVNDQADATNEQIHLTQTRLGQGNYGFGVATGGPFGAGGIMFYDNTTTNLNINAGTGLNTFNVDGTGATVNTTITNLAGGSFFNVNGDNLSGGNNFVTTGNSNGFLLHVTTDIGDNPVAGGAITGLTLNGGGGTSNARNTLTVDDTSSAARNLNYQYLAAGATTGNLDVQPGGANAGLFGTNSGGSLALHVLGIQTLTQVHPNTNDVVTVTGVTGAPNRLTVGLLPNNASAMVFLNGQPYLNAPPETIQGSKPGVAGGGQGTDLNLQGLAVGTGLTLNGGSGAPAGTGNQAIVYAVSEQAVTVPGGTFNLGFGLGVLQPGFGNFNAYDTINASDTQVTTVNNSVGPLTAVNLVPNTFRFQQGAPAVPPANTQPGLIVNGGDETATPLPAVTDNITATVSGNFNIQLNGNLPPQSGAPNGDRLTIVGTGAVNVFSNAAAPPNVTVTSGGGAGFGVNFSSIESVALSAPTVNVIGDNNNTAAQVDSFFITGTGQNAFLLNINGSVPLQFTGVSTLNVTGGTQGGADAVTITPSATANHPWGIDVNVNGGAAAGGALTYYSAPGITNTTTVLVTGPQAGNINAPGIGSATSPQVLRFTNIATVTVNDGAPTLPSGTPPSPTGNAGAFGDTLAITLANGSTNDTANFQFASPVAHATPDITLQAAGGPNLLQVNVDSANIPALAVNGNGGNTNFNVFSPTLPTGTNLPVVLTVNGGSGGTNVLTLFGRANMNNVFANIGGANPTSGIATISGPATARVAYTGLQDPTYVGGGGTSADVLNLTGSGSLSVTGSVTSPAGAPPTTTNGNGTAAVTGQSAIAFVNFGSTSSVNLTGNGGADVFTVQQPSNWGIPTVNVAESPPGANAVFQLVGSDNPDTLTYNPGAGTITDASGAATTTYNTTGINNFSVDGRLPTTAPGDVLILSSFLPGNATLPSGTLGAIPKISYQNIETLRVGTLPTAINDGTAAAPFATTNAGTPVALDITANDQWNTKGSTNPITVAVVAPPAHGTVAVNNPNTPQPTFAYTPFTNYFGADSFTYNLIDANGQVSPTPAAVFLNVLAVAHAPNLTVASPVAGNEGSAAPVNIAGSLSASANAAEVLGISISGVPANATFNQGTNAGGGVWTFTPAQLTGLTITDADGPATLTLTVTATATVTPGVGGATAANIAAPPANTATTTAPLVVNVADVAPTATIGNNGPVNEGNPVTVGLTNPVDPSGPDTTAGFHYSFALTPGGLATTYANSGTAASTQFTFFPSGTNTVWGRIIDKDGFFTDYQTQVSVLAIAHAPTVAVSTPVAANEGTPAPVSIVATKSTSADPNEVLSYSVSGVPAAGTTFNHGANAGGGVWTFNRADLNGLTITVDDGPATLNLTVSVTSTVTGLPPAQVGTPSSVAVTSPLTVDVADVPPTATFTVTGPFMVGQPNTVSFTNQFDPSQPDTTAGFTYQYDLGTGTFGPTTTSASTTFTPTAPGTYTIRGKIIDKDSFSTTYTATNGASVPGGQPGQVVVPNVDLYAVGSGVGGGPIVHVYGSASNALVASFAAYEPTFRGGVTVAVGDVTGDGIPDIITGTGPGGGPVVKVFDGKTLALIGSFFAYEPTFRGGVNVAVGKVNGKVQIVTGAGVGGGPAVKVFDPTTLTMQSSFFAYDASVRGGVNVAVADALGNGQGQIITGAGAGGGPSVKVFTGTGGQLNSFFAYDPSFTGGVYVSGGDLFGSGHANIVTGTGMGGAANLRVFDGQTGALQKSIFAFGPDRITGGALRNGFTVSATHIGGATGKPIVLAGSGPDFGPTVRVFDATLSNPVAELVPYEDTFTGGAYVG